MGKRILVIDDDSGVRKAFELSLKGTGYQVDTAESGEEGIELWKNDPYDLIYLDLKMPGMNGVETLLELRNMDRTVPIYIVTAFYEEYFDELKSAREEGIDFELLRKPFSSDDIVLVTTGILAGSQRGTRA
jgi:CheY-like chemotaxis protein